MVMDVGRICVKIAGREAGRQCVVVEVLDQNFVMIAGPKVKRRRCNITHLEPTDKRIDIPPGADDETIKRAMETAGVV